MHDIISNDYNLNIPLYLEKKAEHNLPTLDEALADLKLSMQAAWQAEDKFKGLLKEFGLL